MAASTIRLDQKKANPDRIMSLVVWPLDFDRAGRLDAPTLRKLTGAIRKFWDGKTAESHVFVDTTKWQPVIFTAATARILVKGFL